MFHRCNSWYNAMIFSDALASGLIQRTRLMPVEIIVFYWRSCLWQVRPGTGMAWSGLIFSVQGWCCAGRFVVVFIIISIIFLLLLLLVLRRQHTHTAKTSTGLKLSTQIGFAKLTCSVILTLLSSFNALKKSLNPTGVGKFHDFRTLHPRISETVGLQDIATFTVIRLQEVAHGLFIHNEIDDLGWP